MLEIKSNKIYGFAFESEWQRWITQKQKKILQKKTNKTVIKKYNKNLLKQKKKKGQK